MWAVSHIEISDATRPLYDGVDPRRETKEPSAMAGLSYQLLRMEASSSGSSFASRPMFGGILPKSAVAKGISSWSRPPRMID